MNLNCFIISVALLAAGLTAGCATEYDIESDHKKDFTERLVLETRTGQYKEKPGDTEWTETTSRIVSGSCRPEVPALTAWGGRKDLTATDIEGTDGYFRLGRVGRRWVFVDPEGGVNIIRGTQNVAYPESSRFASADDWAAETAELLLAYGFNHADFTGVRPQYQLNARNERILNPAEGRKNSHSVALNMLRSFMWDDARNLPWTYDDTDRDMNRLNLIFEERYETYLDEKTREICAQVADDPYMLGYQLDNELGFRGWDYRYGNQDVLLHKFLALPDAAAARRYAEAFVVEKGLNRSEVMTVTKSADVVRLGLSDAYDEFRSRVAEKYYKQYHDVIRKYDRNHLIFGSRLHSNGKYDRQTLQACAKYCDVVTINYYGVWTPEAGKKQAHL